MIFDTCKHNATHWVASIRSLIPGEDDIAPNMFSLPYELLDKSHQKRIDECVGVLYTKCPTKECSSPHLKEAKAFKELFDFVRPKRRGE